MARSASNKASRATVGTAISSASPAKNIIMMIKRPALTEPLHSGSVEIPGQFRPYRQGVQRKPFVKVNFHKLGFLALTLAVAPDHSPQSCKPIPVSAKFG
jgi:hypothetical protein